jgi:3-phosphoshikimate 1-carboxyvinyltransferase
MNVTVPGDKSITQRALILAALAPGESRLTGLLAGADPQSTAGALRALGARIDPIPGDGSLVRVRGAAREGLHAPADALDLGNSGTGARLLMGVLAACPFESVLTGDESLRSRPMKRCTDPLGQMGASFEALENEGRLPLRVRGGPLRALTYDMPIATAQVKSALLLAGLVGRVPVVLTEPGRTRDHTERMFRLVGATVDARSSDGRWRVELSDTPHELPTLQYHVPGDFSSAAFMLAAGLLGIAGGALTIENVGLNPTRTGLLAMLAGMRAQVTVEGGVDDGTEPVANLTVEPAQLTGVTVDGADVLTALDEVPVLVALAARAEGVTRVTGAAELRVKETDRIQALVQGLRAIGVQADELEDGLTLVGTQGPLRGTVDPRLDHRIAMAFGLLGALPGNDIRVLDRGCVDVSFPGFWETLARIRAGEHGSGRGAMLGRREQSNRSVREPVVTLDGPAGSGKSSTAREVARRLGYRHLDSGALYRALTHALLQAGVAAEGWHALAAEDFNRFDIRVEPGSEEAFDILMEGRRVDDVELRGREVTAHVSALAGLPAVRGWLLQRQREAGKRGGLVAEGRDMGTVVFPEAEVKVFLVADLAERARRRLLEHGVESPDDAQVEEEVERIRSRDQRDSEREVSPLRRAHDAWVLDTTALDFDAQVEAIVKRVRDRVTETPSSA